MFSFSSGAWLNWADDAPTENQQQQNQETETEDSQYIDSDQSSNFWHHWSPQIDKKIIARWATFLQNLEAEITRDNLTL
jgi:hypothetical protein